jgi:hypothetical protein
LEELAEKNLTAGVQHLPEDKYPSEVLLPVGVLLPYSVSTAKYFTSVLVPLVVSER